MMWSFHTKYRPSISSMVINRVIIRAGMGNRLNVGTCLLPRRKRSKCEWGIRIRNERKGIVGSVEIGVHILIEREWTIRVSIALSSLDCLRPLR